LPDDGVPSTGEVKVGDVSVMPASVNAPLALVRSTEVVPILTDGKRADATVPVKFPAGIEVQFVRVPLEGVPSAPPETKLPEAVPVNAAVIVVAVKLPLESRATIVEIVLAEVAVVAELGIDVSDAPEPLNVPAVAVPVTVKEPKVPTEVKDDPVTVDLIVVPGRVSALKEVLL